MGNFSCIGAKWIWKEYFLNILGGMDLPTEGKLFIDGENIIGYDDKND